MELDRAIPPGASMWMGGGTKRKLSEACGDDTDPQQSYFDQRQSVLNISMIKLRSQPLRKEQPLRRSVLIFNTLKHIETELRVEGVRWNLPGKASNLLEPTTDTLEPIPGVDAPSGSGLRTPLVGMDSPSNPTAGLRTTGWGPMDTSTALVEQTAESERSSKAHESSSSLSSSSIPSSSQSQTSSSLQSSSLSSLPSQPSSIPSSMSLAVADTTISVFSDTRLAMDGLFNLSGTTSSQQGPLPTFSSLLDLDSCSSSSASAASSSSSPHLPASVPSPSFTQHSTCRMSLSSSQPPPPADVFSDFDFPPLDLDFFSYLPTSLKLPSLSAEDLQNLPHPDSASGAPQATSFSSCNPKHSSDLLMDDLDSIMQILVGM